MSDETFADLFQDKPASRKNLQPGNRVEATVVGMSGENIFLDDGGKSEGILGAAELRNEAGELTVAVGDRVNVFFLASRNGEMVFTTRLGSGQASSRELEEAFHSGIPVEGKVTGEVKGGFSVTVAGQRGFCPYSQMDTRKIDNAADYVGKKFDFIVMDINLQGEYNGLDALRIIQKMPGYKDLPIIASTAYVQPDARDSFIAAGFTDFISKPLLRDKLMEVLRHIFS